MPVTQRALGGFQCVWVVQGTAAVICWYGGVVPQVGLVTLSPWTPIPTHPRPFMWPCAWPLENVTPILTATVTWADTEPFNVSV